MTNARAEDHRQFCGGSRLTLARRRSLLSTAGLAAVAGWSMLAVAPALAQTEGPASTTPEPSRLEEIIVTAQRREENLQVVPVSITALTANTLAQSNITTTAGLQQVTPGLVWTSANRSALPFIRGIGSAEIAVGTESSVALYVDGVYIESTPASMFALNNIERIEVLKGPQGTLFGRNATGGLVQIITKPVSRTPGGIFDVGYGNFNTVSANAYVTGPLTDNVAADLAVTYRNQSDGWGRNVFLNRQINTDRTVGLRSKVLFDFDDTKVTLAGDYTDQKTDIVSERNIVAGSTGRPVNGVITQPVPGFYDSQSNLYPVGVLKTGGVSIHAEHSFGFAQLTNITSYRRTKFTSLLDVDETPLTVLTLQYDNLVKAFTQELQLSSESDGPFRWIGGVFYMHRDGAQPLFKITGTGLGFPPFFGQNTVVNRIVSEVVAPYGQASYRLGTGTELTAGLRYTIEKQHYTGTSIGGTGILAATIDDRLDYKRPTWRFAVNQNFTPTIMGYVSYNRGFKAGAYNAASLTDPPARPETIDAYEAGFKSDLLDGRLRLNAAAFYYDYKDIQLQVPNGASARTINAAQARIEGAELSINAAPTESLKLNAGLSYIPKAEYTRFPNAPAYPPVASGGNSQTSFDGSGSRMIRVPKFTATVGGIYTKRIGNGALQIGGNYYYSSTYFFQVDARIRQTPYHVINGQIGYKLDSGIEVDLWGKNLSDEKYFAGSSETSSAYVYSPAAPRTYGVKIGYQF